MISFFIKHKKSILIITLLFFMGSIIYIGLDAYSRTRYNLNAAQVGRETISWRTLEKATQRQANYLRSKGMDVDEEMMKFLQQQALTTLVTQEVLNQAAKEAGFHVSDYEIAYDIKTSPLFTENGQFNKQRYAYAVREFYQVSPAEFEAQQRRQKMATRFYQTLASIYKMTPEEVKTAYQAQHGNLKDFESNRESFRLALMETKLETTPNAFFDAFNSAVPVKTFIEE